MTLEEFEALPTLASYFPLVFASGSRWTEVTGTCARCGCSVEMRGTVTPWGPEHAVKVYVLDALGYCASCKLLTPFCHRMHADMSVTGERDGTWVRWPAPEPSFWTSVRRWVRRLWAD